MSINSNNNTRLKFSEGADGGVLLAIHHKPDPKFKAVFKKHEYQLLRKKTFQDKPAEVGVNIPPDKDLARKYLIERPFKKKVGESIVMSHSDCNTDEKEMTTSQMNHVEGGWPKDVKQELMEHKNKFIRKTMKEDMFHYTTVRLGLRMENTLMQNNTMDLEEMYFEEVESEEDIEEEKVITIARFKDFSGHKRPVSCLSWQTSGRVLSLASSHCSPDFLGNYEQLCMDCYIIDFENTTVPKNTFSAPSHATVIEFNDKHSNLLGAGCLNGQVKECLYRLKRK